MKEEIEILKSRALRFLSKAKSDLEEGDFDIAAFHVEQAIQLILKYELAKRIGYFPKTHSLSRLFDELSTIKKDAKSFYKRNLVIFKLIEDAYIASRYLPRKYEREEVESMIRLAEKVMRWLRVR
mgnify:CR=1 FL=1